MLYKQFNISSGDGQLVYLVERDPLITENEALEYCERLATYECLCAEVDIDDIGGILNCVTQSTASDISEDEFAYRLLDGYYQLVDTWRSFGNHVNDIFINIYLKCESKVDDNPVCYLFDAQCGQSQDVDTIGVVDKDHPREEVFEDSWKDLLYQLRRYFKVSGLSLKSGVFRAVKISSEDYEAVRQEREVAMV